MGHGEPGDGSGIDRGHAMKPGETTDPSPRPAADPQLVTREALLSKITAQNEALIPDVTGSQRAHEVALTLVQLAAAYAAIVGSENQ